MRRRCTAAGGAAPPELAGTAPRRLESGVLFCEVRLPRKARANRLWIYLPDHSSVEKIPCVLIAPAGSRMFHGMDLGDSDRPEHLPYVRAGFAIVAYELSGSIPQTASSEEALAAARAFKEARAGVADASAALDFVLAQVPQIDPARIYTAGHSSAATTALLVAENEPRIKACVAFAPVCDLRARLGERLVGVLTRSISGYDAFVTQSSPAANLTRLRCPVFLFHADDDTNVPTSEVAACAAELARSNPHVSFVRVPAGDHYQSMIREGIPLAIQWFNRLPLPAAVKRPAGEGECSCRCPGPVYQGSDPRSGCQQMCAPCVST